MKKVIISLILFALLTPHAYAQSSGGCITVAPGLDSEEKKMIQLHNDYRAQNGLPPYKISQKLNIVADSLAQDEAAHGYSAHTDSQGRGMTTRLSACGVSFGSAGENAATYSTTEDAFNGWINSAGHKANILSNRAAMGVARAKRGNNWIWITDFASPNPGGSPTDDNSSDDETTDTLTPTPPGQDETPIPKQGQKFSLEIALPGIGNQTFDNKSPHDEQDQPTIVVYIYPYDTNGNIIDGLIEGPIDFNPTSGAFKGDVSSNTLPSGVYSFKVRSDNSLIKNAGSFTVSPNGTITLPKVGLITGDLNHDNILDLLDYNAILSNYGPVSTRGQSYADLNMNGEVDEEDLNIFYTHLADRQGD